MGRRVRWGGGVRWIGGGVDGGVVRWGGGLDGGVVRYGVIKEWLDGEEG